MIVCICFWQGQPGRPGTTGAAGGKGQKVNEMRIFLSVHTCYPLLQTPGKQNTCAVALESVPGLSIEVRAYLCSSFRDLNNPLEIQELFEFDCIIFNDFLKGEKRYGWNSWNYGIYWGSGKIIISGSLE